MSNNSLLQYLNESQFTSLHVTNATGTDLVISLDPDHTWLTNNNSLYIAPDQYGITGTYITTEPVTTQDNTQINGAQLEFADGKAIQYSATTNTTTLQQLLEQTKDSTYVETIHLSKNKISLQLDASFNATDCTIVAIDTIGTKTDITEHFQ